VNETMLMTLEFEGDLLVNEVTWLELAHQYLKFEVFKKW
jgi:hypothetical protein